MVSRTRMLGIAAATCATLAAGSTAALASGEVNVYTDRQPFLIDPLLEAFTAESGTKVNVVYAKSGIEERLKAEGKNSPADVVMTVDVGRLADMQREGLTQAVSSPVLAANIPAEFRGSDGHWYGQTFRARPLAVHKDRVDASKLTSYLDLAKPEWKGAICIRPGDNDYNLGLIASVIAHEGETKAKEWLRGVKANLARKPQGNDRAQVKGVQEGACDIAIVNTYYIGAMMEDPEQRPAAEAVKLVFPDQATYGAHINVSGAVVTANAPNRDNAVKLLEFLSADKAQEMYAKGNTEYPVKPGVERADLVKSWGEPKFDSASLEAVAKHKAAALRLVNEVAFND
ncbi:MAG: extracellular solute-binding protein [Rhodospirillaceae bacterium]